VQKDENKKIHPQSGRFREIASFYHRKYQRLPSSVHNRNSTSRIAEYYNEKERYMTLTG